MPPSWPKFPILVCFKDEIEECCSYYFGKRFFFLADSVYGYQFYDLSFHMEPKVSDDFKKEGFAFIDVRDHISQFRLL